MAIPINCLYQAPCLNVLERMESGIAKLVYLDPPWFTGASTMFRNEVSSEWRTYFGFIFKVLQQSRRILDDRGCIVFHASPMIVGNARSLLSEVFGLEQFVTEAIWARKGNPSAVIAPQHDTLLVYGRTNSFVPGVVTRSLTREEAQHRHLREDDEGYFRFETLIRIGAYPSHQMEWRGHIPPPGRSWKFSHEKLDDLDRVGRISFDHGGPKLKRYIQDVPIGSIWTDIPPPHKSNMESKGPSVFSRSTELMKRVLDLATLPGDLVIDPFSRSGEMLITAKSEGRRWVGCLGDASSPEKTEPLIEVIPETATNPIGPTTTQFELEQKYPIVDAVYNPVSRTEKLFTWQPPASIQVFVSHASANRVVIENRILPILDRLRCRTWFSPRSIEPAIEWKPEIDLGLEGSHVFLLAMTPASAKSEWVAYELEWALANRSRNIMPILVEPVPFSQFPGGIGAINGLDMCEKDKDIEDSFWRALMNAARGVPKI